MELVYAASNTIEAHMVLNLLEQEGIAGRIDGEYLQGGIGDLPAGGLIRVMAPAERYEEAKAIVAKWDAAQPADISQPPPRPASKGANALLFVAGLAIGLLCSYVYVQGPINTQGIDHNRDGKLDEVWHYSSGGVTIKSQADRNFDGKFDYITNFDAVGAAESVESDDDFDGVFESTTSYLQGSPHLQETDTDKDSFKDLRTNYVDGVMVSVEHVYPATGMPQKTDYFQLGRLTYSLLDTNLDGKMDKRISYTEIGEVKSRDDMLQ
jgi:hypothetical protein